MALNNDLSSNSEPLHRNYKTDRFKIFYETQGLHLYPLMVVQNNLDDKIQVYLASELTSYKLFIKMLYHH